MWKSSLLVLACIQGAVAIPRENLVLDLDASAGVRLDDRQRVLSWTNQAKESLARDFTPNPKGRAVPDSGIPLFIRATETRKFPVIRFRQQELVNSEEDVFDHLTRGSGHTWYAVIAIDDLTARKKDVNSFFGNLRNSNETGGHFEGFWGVFRDDRSVYAGVRNGVEHAQGSANNPEVVSRTKLEKGRFHLVAGRMGAGEGTVTVEVFVNEPIAEANGTVPVNKAANPSKMAIGQERDATNHPGDESFNGDLARLLIYDKTHDPAHMKAVFDELLETYAIKPGSTPTSVKEPR